MLAGRGREALDVDLEPIDPEADLAALGLAHASLGHDDVAVVDLLGQLEGLRQRRLRDAQLEVVGVVLDHHEDQLAHVAMLHDAARDQHPGAIVDQLDLVLATGGHRVNVRSAGGFVEARPPSRRGMMPSTREP